MSEFVQKVQGGIKTASSDILLWMMKLISGAVLGLTFALIVQTLMNYKEGEAPFSFIFMIVAVTAIFLRLAKTWSVVTVLVFDLICVLVGMILCLYIQVAPGA